MKKYIEVDGEKYVSEKEVNTKYYTKEQLDQKVKEELAKEKSECYPAFTIVKGQELLKDDANIIGLGSLKLDGKAVKTKVSVELLIRALDVIRTLKGDTKKEFSDRAVELIFSNDSLLLVGQNKDKTDNFEGVVIAPRVERDY